MSCLSVIGLGIAVLVLIFVGTNVAQARLRPDDPEALAKTTSLGELIATAHRPIHIVYVHGMRADGPGASTKFQEGLCRYVAGLCLDESPPKPLPSYYLKLDPPSIPPTYLGKPIWRSREEWDASTPYVDRYVYARGKNQSVVLDEVNWWPLLFPAKCRFVVQPEVDLSGPDRDHLVLCANDKPPYHAWLSQEELRGALNKKPISGGAALANRYAKQQIVNWGLSDAVLALGPLRTYFRQAMNKAFEYATQVDAKTVSNQEIVVISESLGSFVVLDAFADLFKDSPRAAEVGARTLDLYFFANQYALLSLGRADSVPQKIGEGLESVAPTAISPVDLLELWAQSGVRIAGGRPKQVIAFSDPSDLLTFPVPKLKGKAGNDLALVVNVYDRNEWSFLRLFANPVKAHTDHGGNRDVLKLMLKSKR